MVRKLHQQFLSRSGSGADEVAAQLEVRLDSLTAVRVVSHHMRLLGVLHAGGDADRLVLVDYDDSK